MPAVVAALSVIAFVLKASSSPYSGFAGHSAAIQLCAIDDTQCRDGKCRAWLREHLPEQVEDRMEALGAVMEEWQDLRQSAWHVATRMPVQRDYLEATALLHDNVFLRACIPFRSGSFPARVTTIGIHALSLGAADGSGGELILWNDAWESPEETPKLRVSMTDCDQYAHGYGLAPSFRDFIRYLASIPLDPFPELGNELRFVFNQPRGRHGDLWTELELNEDEQNRSRVGPAPGDSVEWASEASVRSGQRQLLDFLKTVWGVGPVSVDELGLWQQGLDAQSEALEQLGAADLWDIERY